MGSRKGISKEMQRWSVCLMIMLFKGIGSDGCCDVKVRSK
jgi:hypothetical protein